MKFSKILTLATTVLAAGSANAYESIKSKAGNFRFGCAGNTIKFNNQAYVKAMSNFNYMVAENDCKMVGIQPQRGQYNFSACDRHYNKAKELGMAFRGHCLIWHSMPPKWFENLRGNDMRNAIVDHITKTLKYYEGKIDTWDVVNEAIDDGSNGTQWKMRNSFIYQNVPDFIDLAFKTARQVSPKTKLFYNDYNTEGIWGKSEAVYNFVKDLKRRNIPIDGVGIQYHVSVQTYPQYNKINDLISRYCKLGVEVHITEMDVKSAANPNVQSKVYTDALKACLSNSCCTAFLVWGVGDNDSWVGANEKALLFDSNYQPKAAYNALINTLGQFPNRTNGKSNNGGNNGGNNNNNTPSYLSIEDGWYFVKNTGSNKYLQANGSTAGSNVEISSYTGAANQKWKITRNSAGYITLLNGVGEFNLDVANGKDENGTNILIYNAYGGEAQQFGLVKGSNKTYVIVTRVSNGDKALDVYEFGTADGTNVCEWKKAGKSNQTWVFEKTDGKMIEPIFNDHSKDNNNDNNNGNNNNDKKSDATCWSKALGFDCCKSCGAVFFTDSDGEWGVDGDNWCGMPKDCKSTNNASSCKGAQGYPCCKSSCEVYSSDADGSWSVENNDWCLIDKSKC